MSSGKLLSFQIKLAGNCLNGDDAQRDNAFVSKTQFIKQNKRFTDKSNFIGEKNI